MVIANGSVASADEVLSGYGLPLSQLAYYFTEKDSANWTNEYYLGGDHLSGAGGAKGTIDTTASTAYWYDGNLAYESTFDTDIASETTYDPQSTVNAVNFFTSTSTYAGDGGNNQKDNTLGKSWTGDRRIKYVRIKASASIGGNLTGSVHIYLYTYNGTVWSNIATLATATTDNATISYDDIYELDADVQGVAIRLDCNGSASGTPTYDQKFYLIEAVEVGSSTVETNSILNDGVVPKSLVVFGNSSTPTDTSITVDVSDDGGTTFGITGQSLSTPIDTTSFSGSNIALKFNLNTTVDTATSKLYGYGLSITNS